MLYVSENKAAGRLLERLWRTLSRGRDVVVSAAALLLILTACQPFSAPSAGQAPANATTGATAARAACEVRDFEATVLQGKDTGLSVQGTLILQADTSGRLTTQLKTKDGNTTRGSGQVNGRAINLFFDLGGGKNIFGTGTLDHDFAACTGVLGGALAGPDRTDTGAWGCLCCPCYIRTISPTLGLAPRRPLGIAPIAWRGAAGLAAITGNLAPAR